VTELNKPVVQKIELTIVFWDLHGFSKLCNFLSASSISESIAEFLEFYAEVDRVVSRHWGKVNKFIGDGVMALFGLNENYNDEHKHDHAYYAIDAAIELMESFRHLMESKWLGVWEGEVNEEIDIGWKCGINTGEVIFADLGIEQLEYIEPVVNYASRFAGLAPEQWHCDVTNYKQEMSQTTNRRFKLRKYMPSSERKSVKELHYAEFWGCRVLLSGSKHFPISWYIITHIVHSS
jgi:class 3 adenylate cyclase